MTPTPAQQQLLDDIRLETLAVNLPPCLRPTVEIVDTDTGPLLALTVVTVVPDGDDLHDYTAVSTVALTDLERQRHRLGTVVTELVYAAAHAGLDACRLTPTRP